MRGFIAPSILALSVLAVLPEVHAQGVLAPPFAPGGDPAPAPRVTAQLTRTDTPPQAQTFGATATVLLQCRRRVEPAGQRDFVVAAADRSGAAPSVALGDSCADTLRELLDQGLAIVAVTELFPGNTALFTLVRLAGP